VANIVAKKQKSLKELASVMKKLPQSLVNVRNVPKTIVDNPSVQEEVKKIENSLGSDGRVLLRASGTEPIVRVMVEAETQNKADVFAKSLALFIEYLSNEQ
jgi:phosphoglucosamine mutase